MIFFCCKNNAVDPKWSTVQFTAVPLLSLPSLKNRMQSVRPWWTHDPSWASQSFFQRILSLKHRENQSVWVI